MSGGKGSRGGSALPQPKRTLRSATVALMAFAALSAALLGYGIHGNAIYALNDSDAVELPELGANLGSLANRYVRSRVTLEAPAAKFRRPLEPSHFRVARAAPDRWVVYAMPDGYVESRFLPPTLIAGRLVQAKDLGARFSGVAAVTGPEAWVVVDGEAPHGAVWLLGLLALLLGFMVFNLGGIARVLRPVR